MSTVVVMVPTMYTDDLRSKFPRDLNPEEAKSKLEKLLAEGYRIKIMNDFVYGQAVFTHYMLEKEV